MPIEQIPATALRSPKQSIKERATQIIRGLYDAKFPTEARAAKFIFHDGTETVLLSGKKIDCRRGVLYSIAIWLTQSVWKK